LPQTSHRVGGGYGFVVARPPLAQPMVALAAEGFRVQVRDDNASRVEGVSFLDVEEIPRLSHALESMADLTAKWTGRDDRRATDLSFASAGGLRVDVHQSGRVQKIFLSTGTVDPITTSFDVSDIHTLKQAFDQGLALLNTK